LLGPAFAYNAGKGVKFLCDCGLKKCQEIGHVSEADRVELPSQQRGAELRAEHVRALPREGRAANLLVGRKWLAFWHYRPEHRTRSAESGRWVLKDLGPGGYTDARNDQHWSCAVPDYPLDEFIASVRATRVLPAERWLRDSPQPPSTPAAHRQPLAPRSAPGAPRAVTPAAQRPATSAARRRAAAPTPPVDLRRARALHEQSATMETQMLAMQRELNQLRTLGYDTIAEMAGAIERAQAAVRANADVARLATEASSVAAAAQAAAEQQMAAAQATAAEQVAEAQAALEQERRAKGRERAGEAERLRLQWGPLRWDTVRGLDSRWRQHIGAYTWFRSVEANELFLEAINKNGLLTRLRPYQKTTMAVRQGKTPPRSSAVKGVKGRKAILCYQDQYLCYCLYVKVPPTRHPSLRHGRPAARGAL
jgi:hypothetical protein